MKPIWTTCFSACLLALAGCGGGGSAGTEASTSTSSTTTSSTTSSATAPTTPSTTTSTTSTSSVTTSTTTGAAAAAVAQLTVTPASNTVDVGGKFQLSASAKDTAGAEVTGRTVTWASSAPSVISVSASGLATGLAAGTATLTATVDGQSASATVSVVSATNTTPQVRLDAAQTGAALKDLLGANHSPLAASQSGTVTWDASTLFSAFGVSEVRLHDSGVDLCSIYKAATKLNLGVSPAQTVSGCKLTATSGAAHFSWTPSSSADADLDNPDNYDFSAVDETLKATLATGSRLYLRLGESYNGPNDTADPVAWAKVATHVYEHVLGRFKPTAGLAVNPAHVEVFNEPDGGFWRGDATTFNTLFVETVQRVRAAASRAGTQVSVGGAGFTTSVLTSSTKSGNPANGFIANVGANNLDFFSAHWYDSCATASMPQTADYLRKLRALVDNQGGTGKPLHLTEWNIGLGERCGNSFFAEQRLQSFTSGSLTLMQDPAQRIEKAHFYSAMPIMALFDFATAAGQVRVNPSAWALWAHSQIKGAASVSAQVCPATGSCVQGHAAESAAVLALAGLKDGALTAVVTNDSAAAVTYTLRVQGWTQSQAQLTVQTPPAGAQSLSAAGNPAIADAAALTSLLASPSTQTRSALVPDQGTVQATLSIPAYSLQLVRVR